MKPTLRLPSLLSLLVLFAAVPPPAEAGNLGLCLGPSFRIESDYGRGHDELAGVQLGLSAFSVAEHKLQLRASYLTSRMEAAWFHETAEADRFGAGLLLHFRRRYFFDPLLEGEVSFLMADRRPEVLEEGWGFEVKPGLAFNFAGGYFGAEFGLGWKVPQERPWPPVFQAALWKGL